MKLTKKRSGEGLERMAREAGEKVREMKARVGPKLKKAARVTRQKFRQAEQKIAEKVQQSADHARASLIADQRAFVIGRIAERDVRALNGKTLVAQGRRITTAVAAEAERRGVLDKLYQAAGGSLAREFGHAARNLLTATGEQIGKGATQATQTVGRLGKEVRGESHPSDAVPLPAKRKKLTRKSPGTSRRPRRTA